MLGPSVTPPWTTRSYDSVRAEAYNSSYAVCDFDPIPDVDRDQLGELNLEWYSNGQCPSTTDATFHVWNAVLLGATPLGAPLTPNPVNPGLSPNPNPHFNPNPNPITLTLTLPP